MISLWWFANLLAANPYWLGLPGAGILDTFAVLIAAYIPAGILVGAAAGWLVSRKIVAPALRSKIHPVFSLEAVVLLIGIGLWGASQRLRDVQPYLSVLAARPDILAATWIQENTPPETQLLANSFPAFSNSVIVGSDGGWWLPLLAHRHTTIPPITYSFEQDPWPGYRDQVNSLTFEVQAKGIQDPDVLSQLKDRKISYIYIGQRQGQVNSAGPLFTASQLLTDPNFRLVYHQDRVWIFQIR